IVIGAGTAGTYTVTVTDPVTGCFTIDNAIVAQNNVIADAGPDYTICGNAYLVLGTSDPSGGEWDYAWSPASTWENGTDETFAQPEVQVSANIDYTVTVTNPVTGCEATDMMSITFDTNPSIPDATDTIVCLGSSVQIGDPAIAGVIYSWTNSGTLDDATAAQPMASPLSTTTYTVTASFPPYSCANNPTDAVVVTVFDPAFDLGADLTYCPGSGGISIGANAPTTGVDSYSWSPATNLSDANIANPTADPTQTTTYELTVVYSNGCIGQDEIEVVVTSNPNAGIDKTLCLGETTTLGNVGNSGTIVWSGTGLAALDNVNSPTPVFDSELVVAGSYQLEIEQTVSGCTNQDTVDIEVLGAPELPDGIAVDLCSGGCASIGVTEDTDYSYSWFPTDYL
ncbi:MAG: hypothetical protein GY746_16425, partial [Gammaproteobacteria bacterium]|nr:hypothetical protein [Gammaproteobacteria bacterium]